MTYKERVYFCLYWLTYLKVHKGAMFYYHSAGGASTVSWWIRCLCTVHKKSRHLRESFPSSLSSSPPKLWHIKMLTFFLYEWLLLIWIEIIWLQYLWKKARNIGKRLQNVDSTTPGFFWTVSQALQKWKHNAFTFWIWNKMAFLEVFQSITSSIYHSGCLEKFACPFQSATRSKVGKQQKTGFLKWSAIFMWEIQTRIPRTINILKVFQAAL